MKTPERLSLSILAAAMLAAFSPVHAESVAQGTVSVGAGVVSGGRDDRTVFDQYNGLHPGDGAFGILGGEYYRRDDEKGTSIDFRASDLFNGNRELGLRWKKPGDWKFSAEYREFLRNETATVNTGLTGVGTTSPVVTALTGGPGTGSDLDLKIRRKGLGLEFSKVLGDRWVFDGSLRTEKKEGARLWGIGMNCPSPIAPGCRGTTGTEVGWAVLMTPEPVSSNHTQLEARVSYANDRLRVSGGYYASVYRNDYGSMTPVVPGALYNAVGTLLPLSAGLGAILNQPVALPPDNQASQIDLTGSYSLTRNTVLNFKVARSEATQHQDFASSGLMGAPAGVTDLGGKLTTTLAQIGFTARPLPKLSLSGQLRHEDRDDHTPLALYNIEGTSVYTNRLLPRKDERAKLQAAYQFTSDWRGTLGADYQTIDRGTFTASSAIAGVTALRQKTDESGVRAELRRRMTEDLSGAISLESSRRGGSAWLRDNSGTGVTEVTDPASLGVGFTSGIFMPTLADRHRDKARAMVDWQANDSLTLQFAAETGRDRYSSPSAFGVRRSGFDSVSVDWTYALNDKWNLNGYVSRGRQELDQARSDATFTAFDNTATTFGLGFTGKPMSALEIGGMLSMIDDRSTYAQTLDASASGEAVALLAATGGLPDTLFRQDTLKLFGKYTLDKQSAVRVDLAYQRTRWTDWAWGYNGTPFVYSDGTTVFRKPTQSVVFLGVTYIRRWP